MAGSAVGEAVDELHDLRRSFTERAMLAGTDLVVRPLVRAGTTPEELVTMTLGDAPPSDDLPRLRARRRELTQMPFRPLVPTRQRRRHHNLPARIPAKSNGDKCQCTDGERTARRFRNARKSRAAG